MKEEKEDLRVRTKAFALRILRLYSALPQRTDALVLGKQLLRSGTSVGANYREAFRARSDAEFIAKMGDCLKELEETGYWIELLTDSNIFPSEKLALLYEEANQLTAGFVSIINRKKANISDSKSSYS